MTTTDRGTLVEIDGRPTLRFERRFAAPVDRVWRAVTDPDELRVWFPARVEGDRHAGAELRFSFEGGEQPPEPGAVVEWDPPRAWSFDWSSSRIRIALEPEGDGTRMVFTDTPYDPSMAALSGAGWHACLVGLDHHVHGLPAPDGDVWREVHDDYVEHLGPPVATRRDDGTLEWERWHFVEPDRLREVIADPGSWAPGHDVGAAEWDLEPAEHGTRYRTTVRGVTDPMEAARWHALLLQLEMYAASGQYVETRGDIRRADYEALLA